MITKLTITCIMIIKEQIHMVGYISNINCVGFFLIFLYICLPCGWSQIWHISLKPNLYNEHSIIKFCLAFSVTFTALKWEFHKEFNLLLQQVCEWSRFCLYSRGTEVSTASDTLMCWALMKMQQASFSKCLYGHFQWIFPIWLFMSIIKLCSGRRKKEKSDCIFPGIPVYFFLILLQSIFQNLFSSIFLIVKQRTVEQSLGFYSLSRTR